MVESFDDDTSLVPFGDGDIVVNNTGDEVKTVVMAADNPDTNDINIVFFWMLVVAVVFIIGRYSDPIMSTVRRLFASGAEDDEIRPLKLSGGNDYRESQNSFGEKLKDFAEASKATLKKTLTKGKQTLKGAAESVADRQKGRKKKRDDLEDGELTLLNDIDDGIDRLDGEDDRPFQSFASQMQSFS